MIISINGEIIEFNSAIMKDETGDCDFFKNLKGTNLIDIIKRERFSQNKIETVDDLTVNS